MPFPPPSDRQVRLLWTALTTLAVGVLIGLLGLLLWAMGWVVGQLSSVLLPLAMGGILACLLDPVVDWIERRGGSRTRAILTVFALMGVLVLGLLSTVVPRLVFEVGQLRDRIPEYSETAHKNFNRWLTNSTWGVRLSQALTPAPTNTVVLSNAPAVIPARTEPGTGPTNGPVVGAPAAAPATAEAPPSALRTTLMAWLGRVLPAMGSWMLAQVGKAVSWVGLLIGMVLVPVYTFYFLQEKRGIQKAWSDYLPMRESKWKEETIFVLTAINDSIVVFFRGQVLVALCTGTMLTVSFLLLGLPYAVLLGVMAGVLGIIPYLGVMISLVPAVALAAVQFGDWWHPALVVLIFGIANLLEGLVISPKIIGDRVGLHPLTIIIAVLVGTTLMGGLLGGLLAIPLTAALRALMFRYVWRRRS